MRTLSLLTITALAVLFSSSAALATPPPGTMLSGTIQETINTANAYVGEPVEVTGVTAPGANIHNGTMYGHVTRVVRAGQGRPAQLQITMDRLVLGSGANYSVIGVVRGMTAITKRNTVREIAGAVGGMIVGNILAKTIFHASGGGIAGAAGGYLLAKNARQNLTVPAGSGVTVLLSTARRQASHG